MIGLLTCRRGGSGGCSRGRIWCDDGLRTLFRAGGSNEVSLLSGMMSVRGWVSSVRMELQENY